MVAAPAPAAPTETPKYTAWTFGELPELMEVRRGTQVMVGFPALIDRGTHVEIEVFDEPEAAAAQHRAGLRRLVAMQSNSLWAGALPILLSCSNAYSLRDAILPLAAERSWSNMLISASHSRLRSSSENPVLSASGADT